MDDQPTCGKGLAEHSALPSALGKLIAALAENLELHQRTLDLSDPPSRKELDAYVALAREHRDIAARLEATAAHMAGYRDLPMGRHDERALAGPELGFAFKRFVQREEELLSYLTRAVERDKRMLGGSG